MSVKQKIKKIIQNIILVSKEQIIKPIIIPTDKDKLLNDKIALITGGSSGIGFEIAKAFQNSGAKVIIAGTKQNKIDDAISKLGGVASGLVIDIKDINKLPEKVNNAAEIFAENRIDILVNSAGVAAKHEFWEIDEEEYDMVMDTNAKGTFFMSRAVGKYMIEKKLKGHILNISSSSALRPAWTPYQMSKWELKGLTMGLADKLLPYGIVVNAIAPGPTATPMLGKSINDSIYKPDNPSGRYTMPEEIAALAVFMVSSAGDMIVGDTFYMTGGSGTISLHR